MVRVEVVASNVSSNAFEGEYGMFIFRNGCRSMQLNSLRQQNMIEALFMRTELAHWTRFLEITAGRC